MAGYSYSEWITAVGLLIEAPVVSPSSAAPFNNADYNAAIPRAIEFAEQRIYRELDLLMTRATDVTALTVPNDRTVQLPNTIGWIIGQTLIGSNVPIGDPLGNIFIVLEQVAIKTGGRWQPPLLPVSKNAIDQMWPDDTAPQTPSYPTMWCPIDQLTILVAPPPDAAYSVKLFGTIRPTPLSSSNTVTILTTFLPDLFLQCSLIFWAQLQRDLSPGSDQTASHVDYEAKYTALRDSALTEEVRKKLLGPGYTPRSISPIVSPPMN